MQALHCAGDGPHYRHHACLAHCASTGLHHRANVATVEIFHHIIGSAIVAEHLVHINDIAVELADALQPLALGDKVVESFLNLGLDRWRREHRHAVAVTPASRGKIFFHCKIGGDGNSSHHDVGHHLVGNAKSALSQHFHHLVGEAPFHQHSASRQGPLRNFFSHVKSYLMIHNAASVSINVHAHCE